MERGAVFGCWPCPARGPTLIADLILNSQRPDGVDVRSMESGRVGTETLSLFGAGAEQVDAARAEAPVRERAGLQVRSGPRLRMPVPPPRRIVARFDGEMAIPANEPHHLVVQVRSDL